MVVMKPENEPKWGGRRGFYEVWYATTNHLASGTGLWLRYTLHVPPDPGTPADVALWGFAFRRDGPVFSGKRTIPLVDAKLRGGDFILEADELRLAEGHLAGALEQPGGRHLAWDLSFNPSASVLRPLPAAVERAAPSAYVCANPDAAVWGEVRLDDEVLAFEGEPLGQSHVWGKRHAGAWCWTHLNVADGLVIEALQARPHVPLVGPRLPALPFAAALVDGRPRRFLPAGPSRVVGRPEFPGWHVVCRDDAVDLRVTVSASLERFVQVTYHDPGGDDVWCANTEVADATVELRRRAGGAWGPPVSYELAGSAHVEFADRRPLQGVPVVF